MVQLVAILGVKLMVKKTQLSGTALERLGRWIRGQTDVRTDECKDGQTGVRRDRCEDRFLLSPASVKLLTLFSVYFDVSGRGFASPGSAGAA